MAANGRAPAAFFGSSAQEKGRDSEQFAEICADGFQPGLQCFGIAGISDPHASRLLKAVAGSNKSAGFQIQIFAETIGIRIRFIVNERGCSGAGLMIVNSRL